MELADLFWRFAMAIENLLKRKTPPHTVFDHLRRSIRPVLILVKQAEWSSLSADATKDELREIAYLYGERV